MPDAPVQGFDTGKVFYAGAGDDRIVAGELDLKINFGSGVDTFVLKDASIDWATRKTATTTGRWWSRPRPTGTRSSMPRS